MLHSAYKKDNDTDNGKEFFKGVKINRLIASQINHGKEFFEEDKELSLEYSKLNMKAGKQALDDCDHKTAYCYLLTSLSLLPAEKWESHYDFSLRLHFLLADAAKSSCQYEAAQLILCRVFEKARCLEDKLPSYLLQTESECSLSLLILHRLHLSISGSFFHSSSSVLQAQGKSKDVYDTCASVLTQLGETMPPESYSLSTSPIIINETFDAYDAVDGEVWLMGEKSGDKTLDMTLQFYRAIGFASFFIKPHHIAIYFACKAVQLSLKKGVCEHTALAIVQFASGVIKDSNAFAC